MQSDFYNKVAQKFGGYHTKAKYLTEYPDGEPEKIFKEKLLELGDKHKVVLDVGCADGRFTLSVASNFKKIVAIDLSIGMLNSARKLQKEKNIENVVFKKQDASKRIYANNTFDVVYSRRGPNYYIEFYRLLKPEGYFIEINIGEKDCQDIKEIFGRGQGYGNWGSSRLEKDRRELRMAGFEIVFGKSYFYNEYFASYDDLELFLQGVPIFEDFNSEKDKKLLKKYVSISSQEKGIKLPRQRVVLLAKKKP